MRKWNRLFCMKQDNFLFYVLYTSIRTSAAWRRFYELKGKKWIKSVCKHNFVSFCPILAKFRSKQLKI